MYSIVSDKQHSIAPNKKGTLISMGCLDFKNIIFATKSFRTGLGTISIVRDLARI